MYEHMGNGCDARSSFADRPQASPETRMFNITRPNPIDDAFQQLFRGSFPVWIPAPETRTPASTQFRIDVSENDKEYHVLAEMPGVRKEEISITINGNEVIVSAEVKHEKYVKNGITMLRAERYYGKIQRELAFSEEIDEAQAQATYTDGVLELTLPKKNGTAAKKIAVN
jgi:HSP20 family protein